MHWSTRLLRLLEDKGWTAAELARRADVSVDSIYKYLSGKTDQPRGKALSKISAALAVDEHYLRYGSSTESDQMVRKLPLVQLSALGILVEGGDPNTLWDGVSYVSVPVDVASDSFAVQITDESGQPEFKPGEAVICERRAPVVQGRFVVAISTANQSAHFGKYRPGDGGFSVIPVNNHYPEAHIRNKADGFVLARATKHIRDI